MLSIVLSNEDKYYTAKTEENMTSLVPLEVNNLLE